MHAPLPLDIDREEAGVGILAPPPTNYRLEKIVFAALAVASGVTLCTVVSFSQARTGSGDWTNFLNFVNSGPSFYVVLFFTTSLTAGLIFYAKWRRPGGRSAHESVKTEWAATRFRRMVIEKRARNETSPQPNKRESTK